MTTTTTTTTPPVESLAMLLRSLELPALLCYADEAAQKAKREGLSWPGSPKMQFDRARPRFRAIFHRLARTTTTQPLLVRPVHAEARCGQCRACRSRWTARGRALPPQPPAAAPPTRVELHHDAPARPRPAHFDLGQAKRLPPGAWTTRSALPTLPTAAAATTNFSDLKTPEKKNRSGKTRAGSASHQRTSMAAYEGDIDGRLRQALLTAPAAIEVLELAAPAVELGAYDALISEVGT